MQTGIQELKTIAGYELKGKIKVVDPKIEHKRRCPKCEKPVLVLYVRTNYPATPPKVKLNNRHRSRVGYYCQFCDLTFRE